MSEEFSGSKAFLNIPIGVARDKELLKKPKSILLMGEIVSMLNVTGKFFMSNKQLAQRLDCSTVTINDYLNLLEKRGYIRREKVFAKNKALIGRTITAGDTLVKSTLQGWLSPLNTPSKAHLTPLVKSALHKYNNIIEQDNRTNNIYSSSAKKQNEQCIPYKEIIDYLNKKVGAHYKPSSKANQRLIKARWNEGYRLQDFKTVIDNKAFEWQNSDMWQYMRPTTLFKSKFDDYLNANNLNRTKNKPTSGGYDTASTANIPDIPDDELPF